MDWDMGQRADPISSLRLRVDQSGVGDCEDQLTQTQGTGRFSSIVAPKDKLLGQAAFSNQTLLVPQWLTKQNQRLSHRVSTCRVPMSVMPWQLVTLRQTRLLSWDWEVSLVNVKSLKIIIRNKTKQNHGNNPPPRARGQWEGNIIQTLYTCMKMS